MKNLILLIPGLLIALHSNAQQFNGNWFGDLEVQGQTLPLVFHINDDGKEASGTMDSPNQGATDIKIDEVKIDGKEITIQLYTLGITYKGTLTERDNISGKFTQGSFTTEMNLSKPISPAVGSEFEEKVLAPKPKLSYNVDDNISFNNKEQEVTLAGTLTTPFDGNKNTPIVIMITGSGSQNRDSELFGHKPFEVIADYFANNGISSLRFDDRGFAKSTKGNVVEPTTYDLATDVKSAVQYLKVKGYKNIGLMGHSEGGIIAGIVADKMPELKFSILLSAPVLQGNEIINMQMARFSKAMGVADSVYEKDSALVKIATDFVVNYQGSDFENDFKKEIGSAIQQILGVDEKAKENIVNAMLNGGYNNQWYQTFLKLNPAPIYFKSMVNTLAIFGTKDLQVPYPENYDAMNEIKMQKSMANLEVVKFDNLNHLLQHAEKGTLDEYQTIEESIAPEVLKEMVEYIGRFKK